MKTSNPKEQFLSVMKNCKFGVFRDGTRFEKIEEIFSEVCKIERPEEGDMAVYLDGFDIFFGKESLIGISSVKAHFRNHEGASACRKVANLSWLDWLSGQNFDETKRILLESNLIFRTLRYTDDSYGILSNKGNSSLLILFDESKVIQSVYNNFFRMVSYTILKSLESHNLDYSEPVIT